MTNQFLLLLAGAIGLIGFQAPAENFGAEPHYSRGDFHEMIVRGDVAPFERHLASLLPGLLQISGHGSPAERVGADQIFLKLGERAVAPLLDTYHHSSEAGASAMAVRQLVRIGAHLGHCVDRKSECAERVKQVSHLVLDILGDERASTAALEEAARGVDYLELGQPALGSLATAYRALKVRPRSSDREHALAELALTAQRLTGLDRSDWETQLASQRPLVMRSAASLIDEPAAAPSPVDALRPRDAGLAP